MAEKRDQLAALATLTSEQQAAVDEAVKQERKDAVSRVRNRLALAPAAFVGVGGVVVWGWLVVREAARLGIDGGMLASLLGAAAGTAFFVAILTVFAALISYVATVTLIGGKLP